MKYDAADFIIERFVQVQPSWGNSRITYRIMRWDEESKRRTFEGDHFYIGQAHMRLKNEFGIEDPTLVPIVDVEK